MTQDLLALDLQRSELAGLMDLGNRDCSTAFPADVIDAWAASKAEPLAATVGPSYPYGMLTGELERARVNLWGGVRASKASRPQVGVQARMLTDGTWSCGPMTKPPQRRPTVAEVASAIGRTCK